MARKRPVLVVRAVPQVSWLLASWPLVFLAGSCGWILVVGSRLGLQQLHRLLQGDGVSGGALRQEAFTLPCFT